jgi:ketosteroid isomerase-like protein
MLPARSCFVAAALFLTAGVAGQEAIPPALQVMADTEREFASAAKVKGVRDAFLEFFADDAISFGPTPIPAKERLLKRPSQPFSVEELVWEPRTGDVAASGELGWLTGPSTFINHGAQDKTPRYGNYLSVWRRYADGRWRVFIDVGVAAKQPVTFTPGFTRIPFGQRYAGKDGKQAAGESLQAADRELDTRIGSEGASRAYAGYLSSGSRLHRGGVGPIVGSDAIVEWLGRNVPAMSATPGAAEAAGAGDLGYSYGTYELTRPGTPSPRSAPAGGGGGAPPPRF